MNINATLLGQVLSFAILIWFTFKFVWPPLLGAIEERQKKIADGLAAADSCGTTNLPMNQSRIRKTTICPMKVALKSMAASKRYLKCVERCDQPWSWLSSGLANANSIARPTPMRNAASMRPASRNMRPWSIGVSSG